jgi:GR25 family glycosyltransferase involved in LPS biosynthesis
MAEYSGIHLHNIKYFCLHHNLAIERKKYINELLYEQNIIHCEWVESFLPDCKEIITHKKINTIHASNGSYLNNSELSCFLKHKQAIEILSKQENNIYGFIFEDDIKKPDFDLASCLRIFINEMNTINSDLIFIGSYTGYHISSEKICLFCSESTKTRCAHAYLLNSQIAKKILPLLYEIYLPFDWQLNDIIEKLKIKSCWTFPHILQRTEQKEIKSLLR